MESSELDLRVSIPAALLSSHVKYVCTHCLKCVVYCAQRSREELIEKVESYTPAGGAVSEARVLLLGPVGAGKSSFISSVQSVFSGRVLNRAMVGSSVSASFTKKVKKTRKKLTVL